VGTSSNEEVDVIALDGELFGGKRSARVVAIVEAIGEVLSFKACYGLLTGIATRGGSRAKGVAFYRPIGISARLEVLDDDIIGVLLAGSER